MKTPVLVPVAFPIIGNRYHTAWSKNPWMTWTLVAIHSDNTCVLSSKLSRFETKTTDLRVNKLMKKHPDKIAKQLVLTFEKALQL